MAIGNLAGKARISVRNPEAMGEDDFSGFWYSLSRLRRVSQWSGTSLIDTGYLSAKPDRPFEQYRTLILPPDPIPRKNPRQSHDVTGIWPIGNIAGPTTPWNQGFTSYVLGASNPPSYPTNKADVLAQVAAVTGIPTPSALVDHSVVLSPQNSTVNVMGTNATRSFLLLYSPVQPVAYFSEGTALLGAATNLSIGPGQAWFWATAQGLGAPYTGALTAIGLTAGMPLWAWDASPTSGEFINDGGVLVLTQDFGYPTSPVGLPPGAVWNNGYTVGVVPGVIPDPTAPPLYFPQISAYYLMFVGGGNLPLTPQVDGSGQLWNNGGEVAIS